MSPAIKDSGCVALHPTKGLFLGVAFGLCQWSGLEKYLREVGMEVSPVVFPSPEVFHHDIGRSLPEDKFLRECQLVAVNRAVVKPYQAGFYVDMASLLDHPELGPVLRRWTGEDAQSTKGGA